MSERRGRRKLLPPSLHEAFQAQSTLINQGAPMVRPGFFVRQAVGTEYTNDPSQNS